MQLIVKILGLYLFISMAGIDTVSAQVFRDTPLNFENHGDLILKAGSGTKGIAIADYNRDGNLDIYYVVKEEALGADASSWNRLFQYDGQTYNDKTSTAGSGAKGFTELVNSEYHYKLGASWGDYNNDGYPDLFLANSGMDILLRNEGDGTFTDVTSIAGVSGINYRVSSQGLWFDYDNDGDLDLYVSVQKNQGVDDPRDLNYGVENRANRMYQNLGNDLFKDVSSESRLNDSGYTWATLAFDVNRDGNLDLYLANDYGPNKLYINNGDKTFTEQTNTYGLNDYGNGMGLAIGDPDLDNLFDIYLTNITELGTGWDEFPTLFNRLFLNTPENAFVKSEFIKKVAKAGWGWGTDFFDFDNDGDEDLIVANGYIDSGPQVNRLFRNNISIRDTLIFEDYTDLSGFETKTQSFVNAIFDQNDDGFLDVLSSNINMKPIFYFNTNKEGNWIKIWLEGVETNRNGFGSVIKLETNDIQYQRYYHGAGLHTQHILPVHFGLGEHQVIDKITIHWLNGHIDIIEQVQVNQTIRVKEFEGLVSTSTQNQPAINTERIFLIGNYPNPFNPSTVIRYQLSVSSEVSLKVFDMLGREVATLVDGRISAGQHQTHFDAFNLSSGVYIYQLKAGEFMQTRKMLLIK